MSTSRSSRLYALALSVFALSGLALTGSPRAAVGAPQQADAPKQQADKEKEKKPDARIKAALEKLGYKFTVTQMQNYQVEFTLKEKRSQVVFINSGTETFGSLEIREVTSTAFKVKGSLTAEQANRYLLDNDKRKWGGWRTVEDGGYTYLIYAVQLPADADAKTLDNAIDAVMYTADDMEKEVTKADDF